MTDTADRTGLHMPDPHTDDADDLGWTTPEEYPRVWNVSAAHMYKAILRPHVPEPPEYVTVRLPRRDVGFTVAVAQWNLLWESAQFRRRMFDEEELPAELGRIADQGDLNVVFVPRTPSRYYEYAPLFHLLPRSAVERHELPLIRGEHWPFLLDSEGTGQTVPTDFEQRLARAWAGQVWGHLMPSSKMRGFTATDPIKVLAHNLDFWLPPVTAVMQDILRALPEVNNGIVEAPPTLVDGSVLEGAVIANPRMGSDLWRGEAEAAEVTAQVVEKADAGGRLRGILDAVRANRVEDDFSDHWTFAREDFERKLHRKRSKVKVRFVELTDTIPVQGPETEVVGQTVAADFMALLDDRDRQVVVLLNSGVSKLTEVADILGYSNHSPVSKRLTRIRAEAARFFDQS